MTADEWNNMQEDWPLFVNVVAYMIINMHHVIIIDALIVPTYIEIPEISSDVTAAAYSDRNVQLLDWRVWVS